MKKILISIGISLVGLIMLGSLNYKYVEDFNNRVFFTGFTQYGSKEYSLAKETYKKGLGESSNIKTLAFNLGQTFYKLNDYLEAINYFNQSNDSIEKFIGIGNSLSNIGDSLNDFKEKLNKYEESLATYKKGIEKYPKDTNLKFNYEYMKEKIKKEKEKESQKKEDQQDKKDENSNQENQENQNKEDTSKNENSKNESKGEEKDNQKPQNKDDMKDNKKSQQDKNQDKNQDKTQDKSEDKNQDNKPDKKQNQPSTNSNLNKDSLKDENDKDSKEPVSEEALQILDMLENQEEDSLKNNQNIIIRKKEDKNDW